MKFESNMGVFVCPHIFKNSRPILLVVHEDGDWQCLCGQDDHNVDAHLVGIGHLIERDSTLDKLSDLLDGWEAERVSLKGEWLRKKCDNS